ncbi:MAG: tetratricopeptide repeat protein [Bacteroidota bacterium]
MTGKQLTLVSAALLLVFILFYLGYQSSTVKKTGEVATTLSSFNFQTYLEQSKSKIPAEIKGRIILLEEHKSDQANLMNLSRIWDSLKFPFISAQYLFDIAQSQPDEHNWQVAGTKFYDVASFTKDSSMQMVAATNAKNAFEKVLLLNPDNLDAKNALGILYIQVSNDIMKGVQILKEVVAKDSNNLQAIFSLGMLSIQSGQLDKAILRFKKLISLQPFNPEYYYYLADLYAKTGQKEQAIHTYETCKTLLKDKQAKKDIDNIINQLKNT